jgi:hypothetical protein
LRDKTGRDALVRHYERYIAIAQADGVGFILESPIWRASSQSQLIVQLARAGEGDPARLCGGGLDVLRK